MKAEQKKVLIVVAHPDDETLGMGAVIKRHVENGDRVYAISMTDGVSSRARRKDKEAILREKAASEASNILGFSWEAKYHFLGQL